MAEFYHHWKKRFSVKFNKLPVIWFWFQLKNLFSWILQNDWNKQTLLGLEESNAVNIKELPLLSNWYKLAPVSTSRSTIGMSPKLTARWRTVWPLWDSVTSAPWRINCVTRSTSLRSMARASKYLPMVSLVGECRVDRNETFRHRKILGKEFVFPSSKYCFRASSSLPHLVAVPSVKSSASGLS